MFTIGLHMPISKHERARMHGKKRWFMDKPMRGRVKPKQVRDKPTGSQAGQVKAWSAAAVSSSTDSDIVKCRSPLVLSRSLFHNSCLAEHPNELVRQWAVFWSGNARMTYL